MDRIDREEFAKNGWVLHKERALLVKKGELDVLALLEEWRESIRRFFKTVLLESDMDKVIFYIGEIQDTENFLPGYFKREFNAEITSDEKPAWARYVMAKANAD
jgi:hypothetical protein